MRMTRHTMKRILLMMLTLSILSYSAVWASAEHDDHSGNQEQHQHFETDAHPNDQDHDLDADHCCHASAHLTAILYDDLFKQLSINTVAVPDYKFSPPSHKTNPPYRPPLA